MNNFKICTVAFTTIQDLRFKYHSKLYYKERLGELILGQRQCTIWQFWRKQSWSTPKCTECFSCQCFTTQTSFPKFRCIYLFIYLYFILFFSCIVVLTVRHCKHNFHKFDSRVPAVLTSRETVTGDGQRLFVCNDGCMASRRGSSLKLQLQPQTERNHQPQKKIKSKTFSVSPPSLHMCT